MNQNVHLARQSRNLDIQKPVGGVSNFSLRNLTKETEKKDPKEQLKEIGWEPAPEVEFASDKRKRIAKNIKNLYGFSHGGTSKKKKKKKR